MKFERIEDGIKFNQINSKRKSLEWKKKSNVIVSFFPSLAHVRR